MKLYSLNYTELIKVVILFKGYYDIIIYYGVLKLLSVRAVCC